MSYREIFESNNVDLQTILNKVNELPEASGGGSADPVLQEKTVSPSTSSQSVTADSGYDGLSKVTVNAMPTATQATPSISVSSGGLITASATQTEGYVSAGTKSSTKQLTVQAAQTITPSTSNKTIASGRYLTGTQTIKGDSNLVAENIKSGVSIFGVSGSYVGDGSGSGGFPNGTEWTKSSTNITYVYSVHNANGLWVADGGLNGGSCYSTDGKTWTRKSVSFIPNGVADIYNANGIWVAACGNNGICYSTDGVTWTQSNVTDKHVNEIQCANGIWVANNYNYANYNSYYSTDGKTWIDSDVRICSVNYANGIWVAACGNNGICYSTDGVTWTQSNVTDYTEANIIYANGLWFTASNGYPCFSIDGKIWEKKTSQRSINIPYYANGLWVAASSSNAYSYNSIYYSTDVETWTKSNLTNAGFKGIYNANGIWVAFGSQGIYYSRDGKTWTQSNVTSQCHSVYNANGIWVAATDDGFYYSVSYE